jgi:signal transduction histidine kinase
MKPQEERIKEKTIKFVYKATILGSVFSTSMTLLDYIIFKDIYIFYGFWIAMSMSMSIVINNYLTFKKRIIPVKYSILLYITALFSGIILLTYLAGGFGGAFTSIYPIFLILGALLVKRRESIYIAIVVVLVYLTFFFGETFHFITPIVTEPTIIKYSKAIIDMLALIVIAILMSIISKNAEDSTRYYKLRSERLKKIRKRLEVLVKRRTRELENANRRLRELDKKKDEFISIASHELQTPMASMHGFSQLLQDSKIYDDPKKRKKYLKIIETETDRMSKMVKDMLNLSRIDMGTLKFDVEDVNVNDLLEEMQLELEGAASKKKLKLTVHYTKPLPKMRTDKEKLRQIFINLITNSIKYTEKGSITVDAKKRGRYIEFSIADTGIGIPKKEQEKIFDRFYQIESPHTRKVLGAGLGLSLVKEYVKNMRGKMWLDSKVGKGTTFYFTLPIKLRKPRKKKSAGMNKNKK